MTPKQLRFVDEFLVDGNATQAAIRAGYSARTARQTGAENLSKPVIAAAVAEAQAERSQRTRLTADWVIDELRRVAQDRGPGSSHMARVKALELLGKHLGMFAERHLVSGAVALTLEQALAADAELEEWRRQHEPAA